jgi:hypothetical protein
MTYKSTEVGDTQNGALSGAWWLFPTIQSLNLHQMGRRPSHVCESSSCMLLGVVQFFSNYIGQGSGGVEVQMLVARVNGRRLTGAPDEPVMQCITRKMVEYVFTILTSMQKQLLQLFSSANGNKLLLQNIVI